MKIEIHCLYIHDTHSWDEWVPETRLLKWEDSNIKLQKQLIEAQRAKDRAEKEALKASQAEAARAAAALAPGSLGSAGASGSGSGSGAAARASSANGASNANANGSGSNGAVNSAGGASAGGTGARGTKRSRDSLIEEDEFKNKLEIKIVIPDLLKVKLVDDWEAITKNSQVSLG